MFGQVANMKFASTGAHGSFVIAGIITDSGSCLSSTCSICLLLPYHITHVIPYLMYIAFVLCRSYNFRENQTVL